MRKVVASLLAIGLLVGFTIWWHGHVHSIVADMDNRIDEVITALLDDADPSGQEMEDAIKTWEQDEAVLALFLSHSLTNGIDLCFERAQASLELGETNIAITELRAARHMLHDLENSLTRSWRNIM